LDSTQLSGSDSSESFSQQIRRLCVAESWEALEMTFICIKLPATSAGIFSIAGTFYPASAEGQVIVGLKSASNLRGSLARHLSWLAFAFVGATIAVRVA